MQSLIQQVMQIQLAQQSLAFSVYQCQKQQSLRRVPILKPMLLFVLQGAKQVDDQICTAGEFIFLAENTEVTMTNTPDNDSYLAVFIEFDYDDFNRLPILSNRECTTVVGKLDEQLLFALTQFVESTQILPKTTWSLRREELLHLLLDKGHDAILSLLSQPAFSYKVVALLKQDLTRQWTLDSVGKQLGMSASTLRRKLAQENTSFRVINDQVTLGYGMHLLQTTQRPIALVAEQCGYLSPSRFSQQFKKRFGLLPSQLRSTR